MESNRLAACTDPDVRAGIGRHIAWLGAELEDADRRLAEAVRASPAWRERDELLRSIPGIGPVVSRTLLAALPELGTTDGGRLAALVGLAPYAADRAARYSTRRTSARPAEGLRRSAAVARQEGEGGADRGRPQAAGHRQRGRPLRPPVAAGVGDGTLIDLGSPLNHDFAP
jgi:transposase